MSHNESRDFDLIKWFEAHAEATELRDFKRLAVLEDLLESRAVSDLGELPYL